MLSFGAVSFLNPWALSGFGALPLVWLLLRFLPPAPKQVLFPPLRLLLGLGANETAAARTPPWLTALRLGLLAVLIGAVAHPVFNRGSPVQGTGAMVIAVDNGWAAAPDWEARQASLVDWIDRAERANRGVVLLATAAQGGAVSPVNVVTAAEARRHARALQPRPWHTDRAGALKRLALMSNGATGSVVWLADGLAEPAGVEAMDRWISDLRKYGSMTVVQARDRPGLVTLSPTRGGTGLSVKGMRGSRRDGATYHVVSEAGDGTVLARAPLIFAKDNVTATASLEMPAELRERAATLRLEEFSSAASVVVLDDRWRRRAVGVVSGGDGAPLLGSLYYLRRALSPMAEVRAETLSALIARPPAVIMLADPPVPSSAEVAALGNWMSGGGVLVRFAGPRLAKSPTVLVPVALRDGDRALGGAMSWNTPVRLGTFPDVGPFKGLVVPDDVTVRRQVLAEPRADLAQRTWARLADGTPLVTAARRGEGWLVLVHTTANAAWSDLALSGLFVGMLERLVLLGRSGADDGGGVLSPLHMLDGFGRLGGRAATGAGIDAASVSAIQVGPRLPPGVYGRGGYRRALNLGPTVAAMAPIGPLPDGVERATYGEDSETSLRPVLLMIALALAFADMLAALLLRGVIGMPGRVLGGAMVLVVSAAPSFAQGDIPDASLETRLAHVVTGHAEIDRIVHAGLRGLSVIVNRRTAVSLAEPVAVDPGVDTLSLYPLLYWPVVSSTALPDDQAAKRLADYLAHGGVVLFDTGMASEGDAGRGPLRGLAKALALPALASIQADHVLTRSFYLLQAFPGRWDGGRLWVERPDERINDGVSAVLAGENGWAAAWAMDDAQRFELPVVPGGEAQREKALRFGINLVMYVLTGNYKADQVHIRSILDRLKQ